MKRRFLLSLLPGVTLMVALAAPVAAQTAATIPSGIVYTANEEDGSISAN